MTQPAIIPDDLAQTIGGPVMIVVSVANDRFRATIGRSNGAAYCADGRIDVFISAEQCPDTVENATPGRDIAVTFGDPSTYQCWQVKGVIEEASLATATDVARCRLYVERVVTLLTGWDVTRQQLSHTFCTVKLWRVRLRPRDIFNQTPGQGAGDRISGVSA